MIKARIRLHDQWGDVCIRNISSRGLLIQATFAPPRHTYVEVRRGKHVIIARVAWSADQQFGVRTQDRLNVDAVINEPDLSKLYAKKISEAGAERRSTPRSEAAELARRAERGRFFSRTAEFACIAFLGVVAAALAFAGIEHVLARPLAFVSGGLGRR